MKVLAVPVLVVSALVLNGCHRVPQMNFAAVPVAKASVALNADAIAPGQKKSLVVTATGPNGEIYSTGGSRSHKIPWEQLSLTASVVDITSKGQVSLTRDPRALRDFMGHVSVDLVSHPGLHAEADIPLRFNVRYSENYNGNSGIKGTDGTNGIDGSRGTDGSTDIGHETAGGSGSNGTDGTDGSNGGDGGNAHDVIIYLTPHPAAPDHLLQASVAPDFGDHSGPVTYYLIDVNGGTLRISADGGSGGKGGNGGKGGRGGSGGSGFPPGMSGNNGRDGSDGHNGSDGQGGRITVIYDPAAKPFLDILRLSAQNGPRPVYEEQPLPPLW